MSLCKWAVVLWRDDDGGVSVMTVVAGNSTN